MKYFVIALLIVACGSGLFAQNAPVVKQFTHLCDTLRSTK